MANKYLLLLIICFVFVNISFAGVETVTNTNNAGVGSLREAIDLASQGDTIRFSAGLISSGSDTIVLDSTIIFSKPLTFIGLYNSVDTLFISGNDSVRIFDCNLISTTFEKKLVLDSMVFIHGKDLSQGGAIKFNGQKLVVSNSVFRNNTAGRGPAIDGYSADTLFHTFISNCVFSNNLGAYDGGAISLSATSAYVKSAKLVIENSKLNGNSCGNPIPSGSSGNGGGGAFYCYFKAWQSTIKVINSDLNNNMSSVYGGAFFVYSAGSGLDSLIVENCNILNNKANAGGAFGARYLFSGGKRVFVNNSTIANNYSNYKGSGIYTDATLLELNASTLTGNRSNNSEAYIYSTSSSTLTRFNNSTIAYNNTGIYSRSMSIKGSIYVGNHSYFPHTNGVYWSLGNNVFSGTRYNLTGSFGGITLSKTDSCEIDSVALNLGPLQLNGGRTMTMRPNFPSYVIENGDTSDKSNAQNSMISGTREIGATESDLEFTNTTICRSYSMPSGKLTTTEGKFIDTLTNTSGTDSLAYFRIYKTKMNLSIFSNSNFIQTEDSSALSSFQWLDCSNGFAIIPGETGRRLITNGVGQYAVEITKKGCVDTTTCLGLVGVGLNEVKSYKISIYPNPNRGKFTIKTEESLGVKNITIHDVAGREIESVFSETNNQYEIVTPFISGTYFVRIETEAKTIYSKIIIQ